MSVDPLLVNEPAAIDWDASADVVVVGFGGAGVCAALEAKAGGAEVLAIDRFDGGGATALSGGVYYGGGTRHQREAGFADTAEQMFEYLKLETGSVVSEATLRRFCEESNANLQWLESHGVQFAGTLADPPKCDYPGAGKFLYYSGNELSPGYANVASPAPRGHRAVGEGLTGYNFFGPLQRAALANGVSVLTHTIARQLVVDGRGRILGVKAICFNPAGAALRQHEKLIRRVNSGLFLIPDITRWYARRLESIEARHGRPFFIRARRAVVLSTGTFSYNRSMVAHFAPRYERVMPLGTVGCDGSGVQLGMSAGGAVARMDNIYVSRRVNPPEDYVKGIITNPTGKRFINEDAYNGKLGRAIGEECAGHAWIILDRPLYKNALAWAKPGPGRHWFFECLPLFINLIFTIRRATTVRKLALECGMDPDVLSQSVADYNSDCETGYDRLGKAPKYLTNGLRKPPYYAVDISIDRRSYPAQSFPLGGLVVDESTGQVKRDNGEPVPALFAAGRTALGVPSNFYVSGMTLADCVFSGRRAGRNAASAPV